MILGMNMFILDKLNCVYIYRECMTFGNCSFSMDTYIMDSETSLHVVKSFSCMAALRFEEN